MSGRYTGPGWYQTRWCWKGHVSTFPVFISPVPEDFGTPWLRVVLKREDIGQDHGLLVQGEVGVIESIIVHRIEGQDDAA